MAIESRTEAPGRSRQVLRINANTLHADVAAALGGTGTDPGPHDYFDASLAACKALTATVYAKSRGIALEQVVVEITRDDSQEKQGTYVLTVKLGFEGALSDADKQKLHDVVTRCPIHKLMTTSTVEVRQLPL
jgi:putative redox protein